MYFILINQSWQHHESLLVGNENIPHLNILCQNQKIFMGQDIPFPFHSVETKSREIWTIQIYSNQKCINTENVAFTFQLKQLVILQMKTKPDTLYTTAN